MSNVSRSSLIAAPDPGRHAPQRVGRFAFRYARADPQRHRDIPDAGRDKVSLAGRILNALTPERIRVDSKVRQARAECHPLVSSLLDELGKESAAYAEHNLSSELLTRIRAKLLPGMTLDEVIAGGVRAQLTHASVRQLMELQIGLQTNIPDSLRHVEPFNLIASALTDAAAARGNLGVVASMTPKLLDAVCRVWNAPNKDARARIYYDAMKSVNALMAESVAAAGPAGAYTPDGDANRQVLMDAFAVLLERGAMSNEDLKGLFLVLPGNELRNIVYRGNAQTDVAPSSARARVTDIARGCASSLRQKPGEDMHAHERRALNQIANDRVADAAAFASAVIAAADRYEDYQSFQTSGPRDAATNRHVLIDLKRQLEKLLDTPDGLSPESLDDEALRTLPFALGKLGIDHDIASRFNDRCAVQSVARHLNAFQEVSQVSNAELRAITSGLDVLHVQPSAGIQQERSRREAARSHMERALTALSTPEIPSASRDLAQFESLQKRLMAIKSPTRLRMELNNAVTAMSDRPQTEETRNVVEALNSSLTTMDQPGENDVAEILKDLAERLAAPKAELVRRCSDAFSNALQALRQAAKAYGGALPPRLFADALDAHPDHAAIRASLRSSDGQKLRLALISYSKKLENTHRALSIHLRNFADQLHAAAPPRGVRFTRDDAMDSFPVVDAIESGLGIALWIHPVVVDGAGPDRLQQELSQHIAQFKPSPGPARIQLPVAHTPAQLAWVQGFADGAFEPLEAIMSTPDSPLTDEDGMNGKFVGGTTTSRFDAQEADGILTVRFERVIANVGGFVPQGYGQRFNPAEAQHGGARFSYEVTVSANGVARMRSPMQILYIPKAEVDHEARNAARAAKLASAELKREQLRDAQKSKYDSRNW